MAKPTQYCKAIILQLKITLKKKDYLGTYFVVQWLRLHAPNAGGPGSTPSWLELDPICLN